MKCLKWLPFVLKHFLTHLTHELWAFLRIVLSSKNNSNKTRCNWHMRHELVHHGWSLIWRHVSAHVKIQQKISSTEVCLSLYIKSDCPQHLTYSQSFPHFLPMQSTGWHIYKQATCSTTELSCCDYYLLQSHSITSAFYHVVSMS